MDISVGAGSVFSSSGVVALIVIASLSSLASIISGLLLYYISRRAKLEEGQNTALDQANERMNELAIQILNSESKHQARIHALELQLLGCQRDQCSAAANWITREEHEGKIVALSHRIEELITGVHKRLDQYLTQPPAPARGRAKS